MKLLAYAILALCILIGGTTQVLFKMGMNTIGQLDTAEKIFSVETLQVAVHNRYLIAGIILYAVSSILWLIGLSMLDVSLRYPLLSLAYFVTTVLAFLLLNEPVRTTRWIGVALIVIGSILVGLNR